METVEKHKAVSVRLEIRAKSPDGELQEPQRQKFEFIYGVEHQIPTLEKAIEGVSAGYQFHLVIPPKELYGEHDSELLREIPKEGLIKQRVREGHYYRQIRMGALVEFKVLEIRDQTVLVDFNKPSAGVSALMDGEVLAVRKASNEEVSKAAQNQRKKEIGCG